MGKIVGSTTATPFAVDDKNLTNVTDKGLNNITSRKFLQGEAREVKPSSLIQGEAIADFRYDWDEKGLILTKDNVTSYSFTFHEKDELYGYKFIKNFPYVLKDETLSSFSIRYGEQFLNDKSKLKFIVHQGIDQIATREMVDLASSRANEYADEVANEVNERVDQTNAYIEEIVTQLTATNSYSKEIDVRTGGCYLKDGDVITDILVEATDGNIYSFANDDISIYNTIFNAGFNSAVVIDTPPYTIKEPHLALELSGASDQNNNKIDVKRYIVKFFGYGVLNATELQEQVTKNTDSIGDIETALDNIMEADCPLDVGDGKYSVKEPMATALGYATYAGGNSTVGVKGYYYYTMEFTDSGIVLTLTKEQNVKPTKAFAIPYQVGDVVSIINGSKYYDCSTITDVNNNQITLDEVPFKTNEDVNSWEVDDRTIWVNAKASEGEVSLSHYAHGEGENTIARERASHAEGRETIAYGQYGHAEGRATKANYAAHAEGRDTCAEGECSHAEGRLTQATAANAHAEGKETTAEGEYSHTEGYITKTVGRGAHAEGGETTAEGHYSHAEGNYTKANGTASHAEGYHTTTTSTSAHAEGNYTKANGTASHAEGKETIANGEAQHVQGKYNIEDTEGKYAHIQGGGNASDRRNIHTVDWDGNAWFEGAITSGHVITEEDDDSVLVNKGYVKSLIANIISEINNRTE